MISLKEWLEIVGYNISDSNKFQWNCYGPNALTLNSWDIDQNNYDLQIIFDTVNQTVYEVTVDDYINTRAYRVINPAFIDDYSKEAKIRNISPTQAWDDVEYIDLDVYEDFLDKVRAIIAGEPYDTRVAVPLNLGDDILYELMTQAHKRDMTLNKFVEEILEAEVSRREIEIKSHPTVASENKVWTTTVEKAQDSNDLILPLPEDLLESQGWKPGDTLRWIDNKDGSWSLTKVD